MLLLKPEKRSVFVFRFGEHRSKREWLVLSVLSVADIGVRARTGGEEIQGGDRVGVGQGGDRTGPEGTRLLLVYCATHLLGGVRY